MFMEKWQNVKVWREITEQSQKCSAGRHVARCLFFPHIAGGTREGKHQPISWTVSRAVTLK
jgi:hypothetical protein